MYNQLILASASPRRREILEQAGIPFRVQVSDFDENKVREELAAFGQQKADARQEAEKQQDMCVHQKSCGQNPQGEDDFPARYVKALALGKARAVMQEHADEEGLVVLGADTVVVHGGEILNKPVDREDAKRMLMRLQDNVHTVYTGVALCRREGEEAAEPGGVFPNFAVRTEVVFYPMDEAEIEGYLACGEYVDKAGAYAIQGKMAAYIREIHGDYYNVVGLPLSAVVQALKKM